MAAAKMEASSARGDGPCLCSSSGRRMVLPQRKRHGGEMVTAGRLPPIWRATRFQFELTNPSTEKDQPVNSETPVNQRVREFWSGIPGCGRDLEGSLQTPITLSGNRESSRETPSVANRTKKGGNEKTPRGEPLGVFC